MYKIRKEEGEVDKINTLEKSTIRIVKGCSSTEERGRRLIIGQLRTKVFPKANNYCRISFINSPKFLPLQNLNPISQNEYIPHNDPVK